MSESPREEQPGEPSRSGGVPLLPPPDPRSPRTLAPARGSLRESPQIGKMRGQGERNRAPSPQSLAKVGLVPKVGDTPQRGFESVGGPSDNAARCSPEGESPRRTSLYQLDSSENCGAGGPASSESPIARFRKESGPRGQRPTPGTARSVHGAFLPSARRSRGRRKAEPRDPLPRTLDVGRPRRRTGPRPGRSR